MILIVDMCRKKDSLAAYEFVLPVADVAGALGKCRIMHYTDVDHETAQAHERIILTGTALKDDEFLKDKGRFEWIKTCERPILGICAGMEVIGVVYGSRVKKCAEIGMMKIDTVKKNALFSSGFEAYELHNNALEPSGEFAVIARSARCVQGIAHKRKQIYGVMFHPEVKNREIIERFLRCNI